MVSFPSRNEVMDTVINPYRKALDLRLPIHYEVMENDGLSAYTPDHGKHHVFIAGPCIARESNEGRDSAYAILQNADKLSGIVATLCNLHLAEKVNPILSMPLQMLNDVAMGNFFTLHKFTVRMWVDDVLKNKWPELYAARSAADGMRTMNIINDAMMQGEDPEILSMAIYNIAQIAASLQRHEFGRQRSCFEWLERVSPQLSKNLEKITEYWYDVPKITYNAKKDLQLYEEMVMTTAARAGLKPIPRLVKENQKYRWSLKY